MCGVFGWVKFNEPLTPSEIDQARQATRSMVHRGPDHQGEWIHRQVYMGQRRLSIIDLNPEANQPFFEETGSLVLSYNGEIYNYKELKSELQNQGVSFRTTSDTEVLIRAYRQWSFGAFARFDGMFAGALHDQSTQHHLLFRDALGQKPLYYFVYEAGIIYASELRALLSLESFSWKLDAESFLKYLAHCYYPWDTTPIQGVKKLLPGHYLEVGAGKTSLKRYWQSIPGNNPLDVTMDEAVEEFERLFERSCEISMRSDVPFGVFLSGGVDSSLVLDTCHKKNDAISAFCVSMAEPDFDEWPKARMSAEHIGVKDVRTFSMDKESVITSLQEYFSFSDEPHGDPGFVNSHFLAKSCKPAITVALAGDGADELFAGYLPFLALEKEWLGKCLPNGAMRRVQRFVTRILPGDDTYVGFQFKAMSFLQAFPAHPSVRFPLWLASTAPEEIQRLCPWAPPRFLTRNGQVGTVFEEARTVLSELSGKSRAQEFLYFYQKFFLPEFICMHTDRAAMQSSLEVRSPFLSIPLIEFANRLPDRFKTARGGMKILLREVMKRRGFPSQLYAQKKQGFTFPLARWLKNTLNPILEESLPNRSIGNTILDGKYLEKLKCDHLAGHRNNYRILFNIIAFNRWRMRFPQVSV